MVAAAWGVPFTLNGFAPLFSAERGLDLVGLEREKSRPSVAVRDERRLQQGQFKGCKRVFLLELP